MIFSEPTGPMETEWAAYVAGRAPLSPFEADWRNYCEIYAARRLESRDPAPAWWPTKDIAEKTNLHALGESLGISQYQELQEYGARRRADYWRHAIDRLRIQFHEPPRAIVAAPERPTDPDWLVGARLNIADSCFAGSSERVAIRFSRQGEPEPHDVSYGELAGLANRVANSLERDGLKPGDAVALYMPMNVECVAAYLGIILAGLRVVSIADSFSAAEVNKRAGIGNAKCLITVDRYQRGQRRVELYKKIARADLPRMIVIASEDSPPLRTQDTYWSEWLHSKRTHESVVSQPNAVVNVLFSSGTTGEPKAIGWTHLTPIKAAADGHFHQDIRPSDVVAWPTNIGWMMGPWLIFASLVNGATMALYEGAPTGEGFVEFVEQSGVSVLGVIPSIVRSWRQTHSDTDKLSGVRVFSSTGEPSNAEDYLWLMSRADYRAPVIEYLGGTEIGGGHLTGSLLRPSAPSLFNTPALGIDFVILDEDDQPVEEGEAGELFLIPPSIGLSQRLLNRDHDELYYQGTPPGPRGESLRRHGDEILRMADGFFAARGRADDTMNLGGIKISSVELEDVIDRHPLVVESAAVAVHSADNPLDQLVIFVVMKQSSEPQTISETLDRQLQELIKTELNPLFRVHDVVRIDSLPRTASNKITRRSLRANYRESR